MNKMEHKIRLNEYLPQFAQELECKEEDLCILMTPDRTSDWLGSDYYKHNRTENYNDRRVSITQLGDLPIMKQGTKIFGVAKYQAGEAQYLIVTLLDPTGYNYLYTFLVYKRGKLRAIIKHHQLSRQQYVKANILKPVLADGVLETALDNSIRFLQNRRRLKQYAVRAGRGLLFTGPPGNGKTMLCNYIKGLCGLHNKTYDTVSASALEEGFSGDSLQYVVNSADVLFFDDIDTAYLNRKAGGDGRMACALLSALDGIGENKGAVVRIFTTNEDIQNLDPAFKRPGRIDEVIHFDLPTEDLRRRLIESWHEEVVSNIDVDLLVEKTNECSFAILENVKTNLVVYYLKTGAWDLNHVLAEIPLVPGDLNPKSVIGFCGKREAIPYAPLRRMGIRD